jgi:CRISPR/Cas system-associated protein Cas7 (RAMP superfamily)
MESDLPESVAMVCDSSKGLTRIIIVVRDGDSWKKMYQMLLVCRNLLRYLV